MANSLFNRLLGLLFPDRCAGCKQLGDLFCPRCQAALIPYPPDSRPPPACLSSVHVAYLFQSPLREAIHQFKYRRIRRMAEPLGALLASHAALHQPGALVVLAIPLHSARQNERGFNQAEALARVVAQNLRLPFINEGLVRIRATEQQAMMLNARARSDNMRGAFCWNGAAPPDKVLLVDDVYTTGATMAACADALRAAGTTEVHAAALARSRLA